MKKLIHEEETYKIPGACFEVHKRKGCGFLEAVYQESLGIELELQGTPAKALVPTQPSYKGRRLKQAYEAGFVCFDKIPVGIKAVSALADELRAQVQNYLWASGLRVGLLVNFGHYPKVEHERFVL